MLRTLVVNADDALEKVAKVGPVGKACQQYSKAVEAIQALIRKAPALSHIDVETGKGGGMDMLRYRLGLTTHCPK